MDIAKDQNSAVTAQQENTIAHADGARPKSHRRPTATAAHLPSIVIASSFTCLPIFDQLEHVLDQMGVPGRIEQAPYGQLAEQFFDPSSQFSQNTQGLNVCFIRISDWQSHGSPEQASDKVTAFVAAAREFAANVAGHLAVCICPDVPERALPGLEHETYEALKAIPGVAAIRVCDWLDLYGVVEPFDRHADELAHIPFTDEAFAAMAIGLARVARSLNSKPRKVIAVDCDYTLWGGACGDVAPDDLTFGSRYTAVQRFLRDKHEVGFMITICSRNDEQSVERVFAERAHDMALSKGHVAAARVNWRPKWENIESLARELNVGIDSFVLVDDDPFVCAETAARLPEIAVVHVPADSDGLRVLQQSLEFDRFFVTKEDWKRNETYRTDSLRALEARGAVTPQDLNRRLNTVIEVQRAERNHWQRIEQLLTRTNQFTTATMLAAEVRPALLDGSTGWVVSVRDRFGDYGVVAAAITSAREGVFSLSCLAMSCRVLGRGAAEALLDQVMTSAAEADHRQIHVRFRDTGRNRLAHTFLTERSSQSWRLETDDIYVLTCPTQEKTNRTAEHAL